MHKNLYQTKRVCNTILAVMALAVTCCYAKESKVDVELYVAVNGSDTNDGTAEKPFATLEKARDTLRKHGVKQGAVVHVQSGTYVRKNTFTLTDKDSGTEKGTITYRAHGPVRLLGGRQISAKDFRPVSDPAIRERLPAAARDHVLELDLKALGVKNLGPFPDLFRDGGGIVELHVDGKRQTLARWPNQGYTTIKTVIDHGVWEGDKTRGGTFIYRDKRSAQWQKAVSDGLWLKGFWRVPWEPEIVRVSSIDTKARTITQAVAVTGGLGSKYSRNGKGSRKRRGKEKWYALNLLEELDRPGEWCLRFPTGKMYFWPPKDLGRSSVVIADMQDPLISVTNAKNVTIEGFTLEGSQGNGIMVRGGSKVLVAGCEIRSLSGTGVVIDGGTDHRVVSCNVHHLGKGGIYVGGGDRKTLTPCRNEVVNNHIHHIGQLKSTYAPAVMIGAYRSSDPLKSSAVGCRMAHNLIHDLPHAAVLHSGNDNVMEYNEVWRVARDSKDVGVFYTYSDWTSRGNILRHNLVAESPAANAFYMDSRDSGDTVVGNLAWRARIGALIGGGRYNVVEGNLFIECLSGVSLDSRDVRSSFKNQEQRTAWLNKNSTKILLKYLNTLPYKKSPWSERFPEMTNLLENKPELPVGNRITSNAGIECRNPFKFDTSDSRFSSCTVKDNQNLSRSESGLPKDDDFIQTIRQRQLELPKVPGFKPIPMQKIGLFKDGYRTVVAKVGKGGKIVGGKLLNSETDIEHSNKK